uniref:RING-type E3 ubiquitin transferase n=1 Tax=Solanum lycopersicum TaxID=4081 RepID=A0A3Q7FND9_SOLLC
MSSAGADGGGGAAGNQPQNYHCYQCEQTVTITPSPNSELSCPNCNGTFLEESETAPPSNPNPNTHPFFSAATTDDLPFGGGFPIVFSSNAASPAGGAVGFDDLSALFGGMAGGSAALPGRSPNQFDPFAFLNNYFSSMRGGNIQLIFENHPDGGGGGAGGDFRIPGNLGDYFLGPGLEQLIQQLAENDPNRHGTPPAAKSAVAGLPDIKITEELLDSDSSQCAVCKDTFELGMEAKQIPCKHIYHKDCIMPWLELHNSCPVCRYELPTDDPDYENRKTSQQQTVGEIRTVLRHLVQGRGGLGYHCNGFSGDLDHLLRRATVEEQAMMLTIATTTMLLVGSLIQVLEGSRGRRISIKDSPCISSCKRKREVDSVPVIKIVDRKKKVRSSFTLLYSLLYNFICWL